MSNKRILLVDFLRQLDAKEAKMLIIVITRGLIAGLKDTYVSITDSEDLIFNLDILLFSQEQLKDKKLCKLISYGMELEDIQQLVASPQALLKAYEEMEEILVELSFNESTSAKL